MIRFAGGGLIGFALILLWLYCIFEVIATDEILVRNLPKKCAARSRRTRRHRR